MAMEINLSYCAAQPFRFPLFTFSKLATRFSCGGFYCEKKLLRDRTTVQSYYAAIELLRLSNCDGLFTCEGLLLWIRPAFTAT